MDEPINQPERLTDAAREQLAQGARKLVDLQQNFISAWQALLEAAEYFQNAETEQTPADNSQPVRTASYVWGRDSRGETVATSTDGTVLYRSSDTNVFVGPFEFYLCDDQGIIRRQRVDECGTWEIQR